MSSSLVSSRAKHVANTCVAFTTLFFQIGTIASVGRNLITQRWHFRTRVEPSNPPFTPNLTTELFLFDLRQSSLLALPLALLVTFLILLTGAIPFAVSS